MLTHKAMTAEEFLAFVEQHPDKRFDFVDGEVVEVSPKPMHGHKQVLFAVALADYAAAHPVGRVYTEVLHVLGSEKEKFLPDVCINEISDADYLTTPPLLAVEIRSDTQSRDSQRRKARAYIQHGTKMVVLLLPGEQVEVYRPGKEMLILYADDVLDGEDVLPGFKLPLDRLLP